jgi:hypothetical protein
MLKYNKRMAEGNFRTTFNNNSEAYCFTLFNF